MPSAAFLYTKIFFWGSMKGFIPFIEIRRGGFAAPRSDRRSFPYIIFCP